MPGSKALHGWGSEHRISSLPHHLVILHIPELTLVYIMLVSILYVKVTTATLSQGLPSLAYVNRGPEVLWVPLLQQFSLHSLGFSLTLSPLVYGRLLPPADPPGGSTGVMAWGQHSAEMWSAPQC